MKLTSQEVDILRHLNPSKSTIQRFNNSTNNEMKRTLRTLTIEIESLAEEAGTTSLHNVSIREGNRVIFREQNFLSEVSAGISAARLIENRWVPGCGSLIPAHAARRAE